jgi:hypothetical protein
MNVFVFWKSILNYSLFLLSSQDNNIPGADKAMAKARKIVEYFSKSTQQTAKLLEFQATSTLPIYSDAGYRPRKLLQDCVTRWWSTYRMLKRLRLCKPALLCLRAAGSISCEMLRDDQWVILEQIEITLKKMATWQRILEGDKYPTGSLVVSAIFAIREHYTNVIDCPDTQDPVKALATTLLDDFDKRYHPPTEEDKGKVKFSRDPETGERNRYTGVHPYFFIAAYLDLRTKNALKRMMKESEYDDLRLLILDLMVEAAQEKEALNNPKSKNSSDSPRPASKKAKKNQDDFAFEGLYDEHEEIVVQDEMVQLNNIRIRCEHQLAAYDLLPYMKMKDDDGNYSDPLMHWKEAKSQSPELSQLAAKYLTIPATSAPSERVWSRAARVITAKRANLDPEVTSRMIFAQENVRLIREHWNELMPNNHMSESYLPSPFEDIDEDGNLIDVGQDDDNFD